MVGNQKNEADHWCDQPPRREQLPSKRKPGDCDRNQKCGQAQVSKPDVYALQFGHTRMSCCKPGCVFLRWIHRSQNVTETVNYRE